MPMERKKVSIKLPVSTSLDADSKHAQLSSRQSAPATAASEANLTNTSSSTSSSSLSPPGFLKNVQAALKRHRPLGAMPSAALRVRRVPVSQGQAPIGDGDAVASMLDKVSVAETVSLDVSFDQYKGLSIGNVEGTLPLPENVEKFGSSTIAPNQVKHSSHLISSSLPMGSQAVVPVEEQDDVQPYLAAGGNSAYHGVNGLEERMTTDTRMGVIPSHLTSFALTEGDSMRKPPETKNLDQRQQRSQPTEPSGVNLKAHPLEKGSGEMYDQQRLDPMTQCSTVGSCVTSMSLLSCHTGRCTQAASSLQNAAPNQMSESGVGNSVNVHNHSSPNRQRASLNESNSNLGIAKAPHFDEVIGGKSIQVDRSSLQDPAAGLKNSSSVTAEPNQTTKSEKVPRKKKYDPDVFFKVNGKLYQKLGKIGSGGSSEVYKVITSDCTIYALKRIKLKGRDYPTAYGFCQEIEYLNKLKGMSNIIELVDYEVTDKTLLDEVMGGSLKIKDGRIKDDCYIYMVLEYGEIDLAHMLSQKWKEAEATNWKINDNWLRFYWQQMLEAVNTIHEERIVHSDLKPANFLLVKGSLKLIDFGIAKAILSDTTNIQREAQVGTLNYMSPEAFMWNEHDSNGNTIKCGRPSDIWSLGCILYQMVYGKTPFAEYKTFWAKFKVITDSSHEIKYEPISNPWLIDLMKKCLAWDRKERWRIPQLLQHPFLNPPLPLLEIVYTKDEKN